MNTKTEGKKMLTEAILTEAAKKSQARKAEYTKLNAILESYGKNPEDYSEMFLEELTEAVRLVQLNG